MTELGWKKHLLSSGTPLEFETAKILADAGFYVDADYEYLRHDGNVDREFSVDISGTYFRQTTRGTAYQIEILAECKYRSREKTILFYEDPNKEDYSGGIGGYTVPFIDQFVPFHLDGPSIYEFEYAYPFVYKGIELFDKGANEKDFRHACQQLKFAAPEFLLQTLSSMLDEHEEDRCARFLTRVLVSNAPLRVFKPGLTTQKIEQSKAIESISEEVPAVVLMTGVGPEIKNHYRKVLSSLSYSEYRSTCDVIESQLTRNGKRISRGHNRPSDFLRNVIDMNWSSHKFLRQIFVVNSSYLDQFILQLKKSCALSYKNRKKSDEIRMRFKKTAK